ncbi:DUF3306 domain-containing protein [Primorskyibacter sp. 2E233]|uniref:DUF3306 domain-containing protein n=1 Tax=Primorskyibacter sp. 2E233 TaxID=3413431 RepID=UPI003BF300A4
MTSFWERRKAAVEAEEQAERSADEARARAEEEAKQAERPDEEILAELDLPLPEDVQDSDQIKLFLTSAVPARLRTRALRRLWVLNPELANLDGLIDYGGDYTDAATVVENMQTAYQVGRGMLSHILDADEKARQVEAVMGEASVDPEADPESLDETEIPDEQHVEQAMGDGDSPDDLEDEPAEMPVSSRRMRFRFDDPSTT